MMKELWPDACIGDRLPPFGDFDPNALMAFPEPASAEIVSYREKQQTVSPPVTNVQEAIAYIHEQREILNSQRREAVQKIAGYVPSGFSFNEDGYELAKVLLESLLKKYIDNPDINWTFVHKPSLELALDSLHAQSKSIETLSIIQRQFHLGKLNVQEINFELYEKVFAATYNPEVIGKLANSALVSRIVSYFGLKNGNGEMIKTRDGVRFDHKTYFSEIGTTSTSNQSSRDHTWMIEAVAEILRRDGHEALATEIEKMKNEFPYWIEFPFNRESAQGNFSFKAFKNGRVSYMFPDVVARSIQIFLAKNWDRNN